MKKAKIPLSRKGGKVIYILLIISSGEIVKSENKSLKINVNYEDKIVTLDSHKKQTTKKSSKKKIKTVTTSTKKTKSANKNKSVTNTKGKAYLIMQSSSMGIHTYMEGQALLKEQIVVDSLKESIRSLEKVCLGQWKDNLK